METRRLHNKDFGLSLSTISLNELLAYSWSQLVGLAGDRIVIRKLRKMYPSWLFNTKITLKQFDLKHSKQNSPLPDIRLYLRGRLICSVEVKYWILTQQVTEERVKLKVTNKKWPDEGARYCLWILPRDISNLAFDKLATRNIQAINGLNQLGAVLDDKLEVVSAGTPISSNFSGNGVISYTSGGLGSNGPPKAYSLNDDDNIDCSCKQIARPLPADFGLGVPHRSRYSGDNPFIVNALKARGLL